MILQEAGLRPATAQGDRIRVANPPGPQRSWRILVLTALVTLVLLFVLVELVARALFTESPPEAATCLLRHDPAAIVRGKPNCVCREKTFESNWVEYRFNNRGHRAGADYWNKSPGSYRIVMIGSSLAEGWTVPREQSFSYLLPQFLARADGRKVEVYNEGIEAGSALNTDLRFNEALAAQPDMILWPITPWDVQHSRNGVENDQPAAQLSDSTAKKDRWHTLLANLTRKRDLVGGLSTHLRSFFMLQHLLYSSNTIYLAHAEQNPDEYTPSLESQPDAAWVAKLQQLDGYTADMAAKARAAGVPFVIVALPRHAQAVMIASGQWPSNLNPYSFGDQVKAIADRHGVTYVDVLHDFRAFPDIHSGFYPVDQHLNPAGQAVFAEVIAKGLTRGEIPALAPTSQTPQPSTPLRNAE